jgi:iron complex transport system substrate-binding protein
LPPVPASASSAPSSTASIRRRRARSRGVGSYSRIDLERVAALRPDLIIGWQSGNAAAHLDRCAASDSDLSVAAQSYRGRGQRDRAPRRAGRQQSGRRRAAENFASAWPPAEALRRRPPVRTFYQIWKQPLMTVGRRQIISDVIRLCGGDNVFGKLERWRRR